ncbi:MAG TPA: nitroreductase family protein [Acidimicrobiia bacterium]|nr:nitroreductase family protein [Acidimicrobiia bacterium]
MDFVDVLRKRRMVRNFRPDPVPAESIERIVSAARKAPSAGFSQGVSFIVVTEESTRQAIAELAEESTYVATGFDPWISKAPVHLVVAVSEQAYHERYQEPDKLRSDGSEIEWPIPYWWVDAGAALMLVLLGAVEEGLAAGFIGVHSLPGLRELLEIPAEVNPLGIVTLGFPLPDRRSRSLERGWKAQDLVVHYERWRPQKGASYGQEAHSNPVTKTEDELPASRGDV